MMSLINNLNQNRPDETNFQPVFSGVRPQTGWQRELHQPRADELLQMTHDFLRTTLELLHVILDLLRMTLDEIRRDIRANYLKSRPQQL